MEATSWRPGMVRNRRRHLEWVLSCALLLLIATACPGCKRHRRELLLSRGWSTKVRHDGNSFSVMMTTHCYQDGSLVPDGGLIVIYPSGYRPGIVVTLEASKPIIVEDRTIGRTMEAVGGTIVLYSRDRDQLITLASEWDECCLRSNHGKPYVESLLESYFEKQDKEESRLHE